MKKSTKAKIAFNVATGMFVLPVLAVFGRMAYLMYEKDAGLFCVVVGAFVYLGVMMSLMSYHERNKW